MIKNSIFITTLVFITVNCTVKYVKSGPNWEKDLKTFKRLAVQISPESESGISEKKLAAKIAENYLSHHKEFIIYPYRTGSTVCGGFDKKVQGVLQLKIREKETPNKVELSALGKVIPCSKVEVVWEGLAENSYSKNTEENQSLIKTYTQLYGESVAGKVNPYFFLLQSLLEKLDSPILTEDEKDEKIEVESR
ncbi:MXAN_6521/LA_1396 family lipoprotein [Leptospira sp. WS92.C1]